MFEGFRGSEEEGGMWEGDPSAGDKGEVGGDDEREDDDVGVDEGDGGGVEGGVGSIGERRGTGSDQAGMSLGDVRA
jgi:hypothetical protein